MSTLLSLSDAMLEHLLLQWCTPEHGMTVEHIANSCKRLKALVSSHLWSFNHCYCV